MKIILGTTIAYLAITKDLFTAEAGMPQLDPKYWASQAFWLVIVFTVLYFLISTLFIPKIRNSLENRNNKIKNDLDEAKNLKDLSEKKHNEYNFVIENAKKEVQKIIFENKNKLNIDIQKKKKAFESEINLEIEKAQKEITALKNSSIKDINKISEEIASIVIEEISGDKLNESSVKAAIAETSKNKINKYL
jgi:F-type H+-transporting ATPase subunit b